MTTFKQSAFVRVEDHEQRKKLIKWLEHIGYNRQPILCLKPNYNNDNEEYVVCQFNGLYALIDERITFRLLSMNVCFIDCGTNIPMFKALAALRDDTDYYQWFIDSNGNWESTECYRMNAYTEHPYRKATPAEIVEHFKDKE